MHFDRGMLPSIPFSPADPFYFCSSPAHTRLCKRRVSQFLEEIVDASMDFDGSEKLLKRKKIRGYFCRGEKTAKFHLVYDTHDASFCAITET